MEFRSTNDNGYSHLQGDLVTNVSSGGPINSSHGVRLTGGSTGGIVTAAGDEANIALRVLPKGAGPLFLGSSNLVIGAASTSVLMFIQQYRVDWTLPALSSAGAAGSAADSTITVTGLTTSSYLILQQTQRWNSTVDPGIVITGRCSTANELKITQVNCSPSTVSGSTVSANVLQFSY